MAEADTNQPVDAESQRLLDDARRQANWKRWGPYLSERQWGTVREDYSAEGFSWTYFSHDHARSRAYRWGEDGLLGICDRECRLCFALSLWNGKDPILKERLFGLTNPEGNHGEDVKEVYYYLDSTPTHSYMKATYRYPHAAYPYEMLVRENARRNRLQPEFELLDTGVFDGNRFCDVTVEYAKNGPDDIIIRITAVNRGPEKCALHVLPTLWFRNTWSWGKILEGYDMRPILRRAAGDKITVEQQTLGKMEWTMLPVEGGAAPELIFTENDTNIEKVFGTKNGTPYVKDSFHRYVIGGEKEVVNPKGEGTKAAAHYALELAPGASVVIRGRLAPEGAKGMNMDAMDQVIAARRHEADAFYDKKIPANLTPEQKMVSRQAYAGMCWSKQFFYYCVAEWLDGDPAQPTPPERRLTGRNCDWRHLFNRDVISMPDKWEYPWFAAWDLAFHTIPLARVDGEFAKEQLLLMLREWYTHPNGQIPAYEFSFSDVNPPVHAWACWRVYKMTGPRGQRDIAFLARAFQKLMINFTWWVNRKDLSGKHIFAGGFLGLDNIGIFDRSKPLPTGGHLDQADGTAWMAFYCATMLAIALELARHDTVYEDVASKFFEHFVDIIDAINSLDGSGLWDDVDGFYYDHLRTDHWSTPIRIRSAVGLVPIYACIVLEKEAIDRLPGFAKRMRWFLENRKDLARNISFADATNGKHAHYLLAIPTRQRLERIIHYVVDESEFLSPHGVRSMSRFHREHPFVFTAGGQEFRAQYTPGESVTELFGGNSNWRGPIWFPMNYLMIEALERYHHFYGDDFKVECPKGSGHQMTLFEVAQELRIRLASLFTCHDGAGRPCHGAEPKYAGDPLWKDMVLFYEYFDGDTGRGLGANHQTGWTGLIARCLEEVGKGK